MSSIQLSFSIRVSSSVKSVHLAGSWDSYSGQLPLTRSSSSSSKSWKGTFNFKNSTLRPGSRYWYYYIIDGYHLSHNPSVENTIEPTTGRALNILDVPKSSKSSPSKSSPPKSSSSKSSSSKSSSRSSRGRSKKSSHSSRSSQTPSPDRGVPKGRPLSSSRICAPKPTAPYATKNILDITAQGVDGSEYTMDSDCEELYPADYSTPDSRMSYRSDLSSPSSSLSGYSTPDSDISACSCERYGITRSGDRVKIDCQGTRCGMSDSECSESEAEYSSDEDVGPTYSRRHGMVIHA
ncbi:hypothetical protein CFIMG_004979RA [Ceratocystis fimbriata CBS 114723]|uniref:GTP-binding protein EsdC n=1 Tax=Ceratocystis fimbriata CBS 114723 TaxID=1035309 RepID=A0A2C5X4C1_9PEZI|nr:hypothetical protein CFIMG_004979RA [Ceratocystis fimbriata CBS 114723]